MSRWLIALDIDGTTVHDDGFLSPNVHKEVQRVKDLGHEVVIATGRSAANSYPVIRELDFPGKHAVASNGAVSYEYDQAGFQVVEVESFDPSPVLTRLIDVIPNAHFAVEDLDGTYRFHKPFPTYALVKKTSRPLGRAFASSG